MITRTEIAQLPAKGRTQLFDELMGALFQTQGECATALEVTRKTLQNWRGNDNVPLMALYAMHSMAEAKLGAELATVAESLVRAVLILERITSALPGTRESSGTTEAVALHSAGSD